MQALFPVNFGPWRPDLPEVGTGYTTHISNARPGTDGFRPVSSAAVDTAYALPAQALNLAVARSTDGTLASFVAAGNRLYLWTPGGTGTLVDISQGATDYTLEADSSWDFEIFGSLEIAANGGTPLQSYLLGAGPTFVDLSPTAPHARYVTVVRDQLMACVTGPNAASLVINQVAWGPIGAPDGVWTPDATTQAGAQILHDMGEIKGITGGEFALILTDRGIVRATYVNVPWIYQFDVIARNIGTRWPTTIAQYNRITYFWAPDGIYACNGEAVVDIGAQKVNQWLLADFDFTLQHRVRAQVDAQRGLVVWSYPGAGHNAAGDPNRLLIYDPAVQEFGLQNIEAETIGLTQVGGYAPDALLWTELTHGDVNLDAREYQAEDVVLSIVDPTGSDIQYLSGIGEAAEFDTGELQVAPGRKSTLSEVAAVYEGFGHTVSVGVRDTRSGTQRWQHGMAPLPDGHVRPRAVGRYHRVRLSLDQGWTSAVGFNLGGKPIGVR